MVSVAVVVVRPTNPADPAVRPWFEHSDTAEVASQSAVESLGAAARPMPIGLGAAVPDGAFSEQLGEGAGAEVRVTVGAVVLLVGLCGRVSAGLSWSGPAWWTGWSDMRAISLVALSQ